MLTSTLPVSEIKMEITENSEGLQNHENTKNIPDPSTEIGKYPAVCNLEWNINCQINVNSSKAFWILYKYY